jgi:hypothetical protein
MPGLRGPCIQVFYGEGMKKKASMDFWAGLMFIAFGLFFVIVSRNYQMGTAMRMGSGYFPTVLGGLMAVLGVIVFLQSLVGKGGKAPVMFIRPLFFITLSLLVFGYLLKLTGMVFSIALLVVVSALAGYEFKLKEVFILSVVLALLSALVFVKGLGLPFPLWPGFLG